MKSNEILTFAGDICDAKRSICAFGDVYSNSVVYIVGDSHALNLLFGLDELFRAKGIKGIALYDHGCLFLSGTSKFRNGVKDGRCAERIEAAYTLLEKNANPIVFAGFYSLYRNKVGGAESTAALKQSEAEYSDWLQQQLRISMRRLRPDTRSIVVIGQSYHTGINVAQCLRQPGRQPEDCKHATRAGALKRTELIDRAIQSLNSDFPSIAIIDPKEVFCPAEECTVRAGNKLLFRDATHLTNEGSSFLIQGVARKLVEGLKLK